MRLNGTVKFFNSVRGFGFISPDNGEKDVFVHASALESSGIPALKEGDKVSFDVENDHRSRQTGGEHRSILIDASGELSA